MLIVTWLLICYAPDAYRVPTICRTLCSLSQRQGCTGVWYGFHHSHGWWCWVKWVSLLAVLVLAGGWGLGREQHVGET